MLAKRLSTGSVFSLYTVLEEFPIFVLYSKLMKLKLTIAIAVAVVGISGVALGVTHSYRLTIINNCPSSKTVGIVCNYSDKGVMAEKRITTDTLPITTTRNYSQTISSIFSTRYPCSYFTLSLGENTGSSLKLKSSQLNSTVILNGTAATCKPTL